MQYYTFTNHSEGGRNIGNAALTIGFHTPELVQLLNLEWCNETNSLVQQPSILLFFTHRIFFYYRNIFQSKLFIFVYDY